MFEIKDLKFEISTIARAAPYNNAPEYTSSRLSDYSLVKELS